MANKRVLGVFTLNCLQTGHWVRVDYHIVMDWAHVLVIVQCQTDGCSLSCKDGAVVWQSFGQLAAGCLTILEMAVDDRRCPHSLVHFGAISVDFITKHIELSLECTVLQESCDEYYRADTLKTPFELISKVCTVQFVRGVRIIWYERRNIQYESSFESVCNWHTH